MDKRTSPEMQTLIELVDSPHWDQLMEEAAAYADMLRQLALHPAANPMDFYTKEGYAKAATELENFFSTVRDAVSRALAKDTDV